MLVYQRIAFLLEARANCARKMLSDDSAREWFEEHGARLETIARNCLPRGSGFNNGTRIDLALSKPDCIVMHVSFQHMNDHGFYVGWTDHVVRVRPSLAHGFTLSVTGPDRNDMKEYIADSFDTCLRDEMKVF